MSPSEESARTRAELRLLQVALHALAAADSPADALRSVLDLVCAHTGWPVGHAYLRDPADVLAPSDVWHTEPAYEGFRAVTMAKPLRAGHGLPGRVLATRRSEVIEDLAADPDFARKDAAAACGLVAGVGVPVLSGGDVEAVLEFFAPRLIAADSEFVGLLESLATQLGRAWQRQRADAALLASEERFRTVAETAYDAIVTADQTCRVGYVNPAAVRLFGYERPEQMVGRSLTDLMPERYREAHAAGFRRFLDERVPRLIGRMVEVEALRADGSEVPIELSVAHGRTADGDIFTAIMRDVTERKRTESFLRRALEREQQAAESKRTLDRMQESFLTAVSHEMRTPLASVLGIALTLDRKPDLPREAQRDMLRLLATNAHRLDQLLEDLLDVDRLARGVVALDRGEADLGALVRRVVGHCGLSGRAVSVEVRGEPLRAEVDAAKVERVLEHLLGNVVRHTPAETSVWVCVERTPEGVLLRVEDDGPGVPEEIKDPVFQRFRQGPSLRPHSPGTGIGLTLVSRFAELHGGRAWVEDRPGGGAAFRVLLPEAA